MIVTHEEARKKRCPVEGGLCMGEECMAWKADYDYHVPGNPVMPMKRDTKSNGKGYCGMVKNEH